MPGITSTQPLRRVAASSAIHVVTSGSRSSFQTSPPSWCHGRCVPWLAGLFITIARKIEMLACSP